MFTAVTLDHSVRDLIDWKETKKNGGREFTLFDTYSNQFFFNPPPFHRLIFLMGNLCFYDIDSDILCQQLQQMNHLNACLADRILMKEEKIASDDNI